MLNDVMDRIANKGTHRKLGPNGAMPVIGAGSWLCGKGLGDTTIDLAGSRGSN